MTDPLITRLKEATEPSRELDADLFELTQGQPKMEAPYDHFTMRRAPDHKWVSDENVHGLHMTWTPPAYTSDLNVTKSEIEKRFPGCDWEIGTCGPHIPGYRASIIDQHPVNGRPWNAEAYHDLVEYAAVLALLEAMESQGG